MGSQGAKNKEDNQEANREGKEKSIGGGAGKSVGVKTHDTDQRGKPDGERHHPREHRNHDFIARHRLHDRMMQVRERKGITNFMELNKGPEFWGEMTGEILGAQVENLFRNWLMMCYFVARNP